MSSINRSEGNQESSAAPTPDGRNVEFRAVEQGQTRSGEVLLVEAYAIAWVILFAFVGIIWRKHTKLAARIDALDSAIDKHAQGKNPAAKKD
jgi:hypothetical protein